MTASARAGRPRRARGWWIGAGGLVLVMAYITWCSIDAASRPNGYRARHGWDVAVMGPWQFPADAVRTWLAVMVVEGALAIWLLANRTRVSLAARSLMIATLMIVVMFALAPMGMHAGAPFPQHLSWLLLGAIWLVVFAIGVAVAAWATALRLRSGPPDPPGSALP